jgi:hypothetical protein
MEAPVEIRYSGVILGRINEMPNAGETAPFFLPMREPLPVGTVLHLRLEDRETPVRVVRTVESPDPDVAGMHVRAIGESEVVAFEFIPAPVPMLLDPPKSEPATPVVEIDAQKSAPEAIAVAAPADAAVAVEATSSAAAATEAVPEAVPTAVGSSLTGAIANATDSVDSESAVVSSEAAGDSSMPSGASSTEDLPPARPISGSSGRRKTKRRK